MDPINLYNAWVTYGLWFVFIAIVVSIVLLLLIRLISSKGAEVAGGISDRLTKIDSIHSSMADYRGAPVCHGDMLAIMEEVRQTIEIMNTSLSDHEKRFEGLISEVSSQVGWLKNIHDRRAENGTRFTWDVPCSWGDAIKNIEETSMKVLDEVREQHAENMRNTNQVMLEITRFLSTNKGARR
jgi:hypothetical protein